MAFHLGAWLRGGFIGVDVFFVLSGFLITALLLGEYRATGRLDLPAFWARRARRLLPALLLLLLVLGAWAAWVAPPETSSALRGDALAALFDVANWWFVATGESYGTDTRVFQLLLGAALATAVHTRGLPRPRTIRRTASLGGQGTLGG